MENREAIELVIAAFDEWEYLKDTGDDWTEVHEARDLAISALEKQEVIKSCTPPSDDWEHYADRLHDIAYQTGYEQGKKDAGQDGWIPVTERLPETTDEVLTTYINNGNRKKRYVETATYYPDDGEGTWSSPWDEYRVAGTVVEVLAWRPLPAPYQEEEA